MPRAVRAQEAPEDGAARAAIWPDEMPSSDGLGMYVDIIRGRILIVILVTAVTVGTALLVVSQLEKTYEARADLLVTPIPRVNESLYGLGLVSESGEPTRDAETLSQLITTREVAERVRERLRLDRSAGSLLASVNAQPVAQSSIVTISAKSSDPEEAAKLADAFGSAAIDVRTERLHALLEDLIPRLREQLASVPPNEARAREALSGRLRDLESLRLLPDPTLHFETRAAVPTGPISPRPALTLIAAFISGLIVSIAGLLLAHVVNPRIERESDLRRYRLPIVARIPRQSQGLVLTRQDPLLPAQLRPSTAEAFHRFATTLVAGAQTERSVFITSPGNNDGKSTTAVNLASTLASLQENVVLVDGDSRRAALGSLLTATPTHGFGDVVSGRASLGAATLRDPRLADGTAVLAQTPSDAATIPVQSDAADRLVREATARNRWLVVDGPPLTFAPEMLTLARRADKLIVIVRLRGTRLRDLTDLMELLAQQQLTPTGFVVVGSRARAVYRPIIPSAPIRAAAS